MRKLLIVLLSSLFTSAVAQERPLPDHQTFLQEVRKRLQTDERKQGSYMYVETRRERSLDNSGNATRETVEVLESYPGLPGEPRWSRLISIDGKPVPAAELEKQDRDRQKKVQDYLRKRARQTDSARAAEAREREKERRKDATTVDDGFRIFDIQMVGREYLEGHATIVFLMRPRPDAQPRTREGGMLRHFAGKAWISESDYELVRLEVEALDTVSFGWGIFARVHKGSRAAYQRRKVNGEDW